MRTRQVREQGGRGSIAWMPLVAEYETENTSIGSAIAEIPWSWATRRAGLMSALGMRLIRPSLSVRVPVDQ